MHIKHAKKQKIIRAPPPYHPNHRSTLGQSLEVECYLPSPLALPDLSSVVSATRLAWPELHVQPHRPTAQSSGRTAVSLPFRVPHRFRNGCIRVHVSGCRNIALLVSSSASWLRYALCVDGRHGDVLKPTRLSPTSHRNSLKVCRILEGCTGILHALG